jgi:hypothetical protein
MASLTPKKVGRGTLVKRLLTLSNATGATFDIAVSDPSNLVVLVQGTTQTTGKFTVTVNCSTSGFTGQGVGNFTFNSTNAAKGNPLYIVGPFESARFLDVSTGGRVVEVKVASTSGKVLAATSVDLTAFEIVASS